jgi:CTP synthase
VISDPDFDHVYELPLIFEKEGMPYLVRNKLKLKETSKLTKWKKLVQNIKSPTKEVNIAICGKYTTLHDSYISIMESLKHAQAHLKIKSNIKWIETTKLENATEEEIEKELKDIQGVIVPGGFGSRGTEGKIKVIKYIRENKIPFLGICLGFQLAVIEFARNVCNLKNANSTEINKNTPHPVIDLLAEQKNVTEKGGTMRLGGQDVSVKKGTKAYQIFNKEVIRRRFRHRWEVNEKYIPKLEEKGLVFSGTTPDGKIMQIMELKDHPYFMGGQFHPELTSGLEKPSEMFVELVRKAGEQKRN